MLTNVAQRWFKGRAFYRPAREPFNPRLFEVAPIAEDRIAKAFVQTHHYSGSYPAARERFGLYQAGALVGVAVFSVGRGPHVMRILPCEPAASVELGRFVLLDRVGANAETWFFARCRELLARDGYAGIVSFSDPVARTDARGRQVFPGHIGTIYQASNALYTGRGRARTKHLLPDGTVFDERAKTKIRAQAKGWRYAVDQLVAAGAPAPMDMSLAGLRSWIDLALSQATRPLRHTGNHRYLWGLDRATTRALPHHLAQIKITILPYPKMDICT